MRIGLLRRLAAMQPGELRFRMLCESRKIAGRVRTALSTPGWRRADLTGVLATGASRSASWNAAIDALRSGDFSRAHAQLATYWPQRTTAFPLAAREVPGRAGLIREHCPGATPAAIERALLVGQGRYDLLGYQDLHLGPDPDWHADPVHHRRSPRTFWAGVPYLDPACGDHKIIWELNRHQHWLMLARAHALTGDSCHYAVFTSQLASWLRANPPLIGTNWASMLELAFRSLSWLWALEIFAGAAGTDDREPWLVDLLLALDRQLTHIEHNLSHYFSPNTHLTGEALALYVSGLSLPELAHSVRRAAIGRDVLVREASRQIRSDGGHAELSPHYHRYSTDFYLLAALVARRAGDTAAPIFEETVKAQARYLRAIVDDAGVRPLIGDDDGGQLFPMCGRPVADCRDTLATAAIVLHDSTLGIGEVPEETHWLCGEAARRPAAQPPAKWPSVALTASGYYVSRTVRGDHLIFDAGPHGFLNGAHAHADALSIVLGVQGRPFLIDPGTATYTTNAETRDRFRTTRMHNTVVLDGRSQSEPRGAFHWKSSATARAAVWRSSSDCDYIEGSHDGYTPTRHSRGILAIPGIGWWIVDHVLGEGPGTIDTCWHIHPSWTCVLASHEVCELQQDTLRLALVSSAPMTLHAPGTDPVAIWSPVYGAIEPAPVVCTSLTSVRPASVATFIPASSEGSELLAIQQLEIQSAPGPGWYGAAWRVRWRGGAMTLLSAIETSGLADRDTSAPSVRWGTAELQTDARVGLVIDRAAATTEAILVNGSVVAAHDGGALVSVARRQPILRLAQAALAPSVHEVATTE